jgi:hypothetical protein
MSSGRGGQEGAGQGCGLDVAEGYRRRWAAPWSWTWGIGARGRTWGVVLQVPACAVQWLEAAEGLGRGSSSRDAGKQVCQCVAWARAWRAFPLRFARLRLCMFWGFVCHTLRARMLWGFACEVRALPLCAF